MTDPSTGERDDKHSSRLSRASTAWSTGSRSPREPTTGRTSPDFVYVTEVEGEPDLVDAAKYKRFEGWLGVRAFL